MLLLVYGYIGFIFTLLFLTSYLDEVLNLSFFFTFAKWFYLPVTYSYVGDKMAS